MSLEKKGRSFMTLLGMPSGSHQMLPPSHPDALQTSRHVFVMPSCPNAAASAR